MGMVRVPFDSKVRYERFMLDLLSAVFIFRGNGCPFYGRREEKKGDTELFKVVLQFCIIILAFTAFCASVLFTSGKKPANYGFVPTPSPPPPSPSFVAKAGLYGFLHSAVQRLKRSHIEIVFIKGPLQV